MVIGTKRYFPYPVLWLDDMTDYKNGSFHSEVSISLHQNGNNLKIDSKFILKNQDLKRRLAISEVAFSLHVECAATGFRKAYQTQSEEFSCLIPECQINGELQVCTFLVAMRDISPYTNSDYADIIREMPFSVEQGCILGIAESFSFMIDTQKIDLGKISSVVNFIKNDDPLSRSIEVDSSGKRIIVTLPQETFSHYKQTKTIYGSESASLLTSIFVIPALMAVMSELLKSEAEERLLLYGDKNWYRAFDARLRKIKGISLDSIRAEEVDVLRLVQEMIDNPSYMALKILNDTWQDDDGDVL